MPGDIAKAYGAGADFVMLGGMLAGHDECDGEIRYEERDGEEVPVGMMFYGMSSETAMKKHSGGVAHYRAAEGKSGRTPYRGPVDEDDGRDHGRRPLMMTYIGAAHLKEVPKRTTFVRVTAGPTTYSEDEVAPLRAVIKLPANLHRSEFEFSIRTKTGGATTGLCEVSGSGDFDL